MRAPLLAFLMTSVVLAGCFADDDPDVPDPSPTTTPRVGSSPSFEVTDVDVHGLPVPRLLCHDLVDMPAKAEPSQIALGARCNFEMTPDDGRQGNEVTIAVNPMDPRNIVGGAKDYYPPDAGQCVWDGVYVTHDGGRTVYQDRSFDGSPWRLYDGDVSGFTPNYASTFWCTTDPVTYFNTDGTLYYLLMAYQTDPITGGKTGEGVGQGALNDWAFNRATQIVAVSDDGGDTFHTFTPVFEGSFPIDFHDKGWIAASHNGVIHVFWLAILAPGNMYFRSTDGGQTFPATEMEVLASVGQGSGQGSFVDVGTGPEVYALWYSGGVQMRRSLDYGETWEPQFEAFNTNGISMPTIDSRDRRGGFPQLATDRNPDSPFADALYVAWQDACQTDEWSNDCQAGDGEEQLGGSAIWVRASFDKGDTWTNATRVSDAPTGPNQWRIFPTLSVSPGGVLDVSWMDARDTRLIDCPANPVHGQARCPGQYQALTQYHSYSVDGGRTWSQDFHVRADADDQGWDPAFCHHQNGDIFIGDYNDIDSSWQAAHPVWPDTRAGVCDVYTATVQRPAFADGWDADKKAAAEQWMAEHPL